MRVKRGEDWSALGLIARPSSFSISLCRILSKLSTDFTLTRLIAQQYASADSIAANIEEGYGRGSRKEYTQFLIIARGSAQETMGRYQRFKHWLPEGTINLRTLLCREIIAILTATIKKLRTLDPK